MKPWGTHAVRAARTALIIAAIVGLASGCMTYQTRTDPGYDGPPIYSGTRTAWSNLGESTLSLQITLMLISLVDLPFSFLADTAMLPVTVPESRARADAASISVEDPLLIEQPSPVDVPEGTDALRAAALLYDECLRRLEQLDPTLTDCYSIDARIEIIAVSDSGAIGGRKLNGVEYKRYIVGRISRARATSDYITFRGATFEPEGDAVRVRAYRHSASTSARHTVSLLVGPGPDGGWRILEENSAGWPD